MPVALVVQPNYEAGIFKEENGIYRVVTRYVLFDRMWEGNTQYVNSLVEATEIFNKFVREEQDKC